jgi:hypothetical protein
MARKSKFRAYDARTGRLERAIDMVEDSVTGLRMIPGEIDKKHPKPIRNVPLDRVAILGKDWVIETQKGLTQIDVGYTGNSNFERPGIPSVTLSSTSGYAEYVTVYGFGQEGFGGYVSPYYGPYGYGGLDETDTRSNF